jgi:hypothetical protein
MHLRQVIELTCADPEARTPIGASGNLIFIFHPGYMTVDNVPITKASLCQILCLLSPHFELGEIISQLGPWLLEHYILTSDNSASANSGQNIVKTKIYIQRFFDHPLRFYQRYETGFSDV